jgi:hypothetical protein
MERRMDIFISKSEGKSFAVAMILRDWLQEMKLGDPWMSEDIPPGANWREELIKALKKARVGILCLTADNLTNQWILHEASTLLASNRVKVFPYVIDTSVNFRDLADPISHLQATRADRRGTEALGIAINNALNRVPDLTRQVAFNSSWGKVKSRLDGLIPPLPPVDVVEEVIKDFIELCRDIREYREAINFSPIVGKAIRLHDQKTFARGVFAQYVYKMIEEHRGPLDRNSRLIGNVRDFFREQFTGS